MTAAHIPHVPSIHYPDGNPKTSFGVKKPPLWFVPFSALYRTALALMHGALKYGHFNWRHDKVSASTYINAAMRHISEWKEGGSVAEDSGVHHLAHAAACLFIVMDAEYSGTLIDDRSVADTNLDALFKELAPVMQRLYDEWGHVKPPQRTKAEFMIAILNSEQKNAKV